MMSERRTTKQSKSSTPKAIPPQYGLNKAANNVVKELDNMERLAAV